MIKKITTYIIAIIWPVLLTACADNYVNGGNFDPSLTSNNLRVSVTTFQHAASAFSETFEVKSENVSWQFGSMPNWASLSPESGIDSQKVTLSVEKNPLSESRTAIFYLNSIDSDPEYNIAMSIFQEGDLPSVSVDESAVNFGGAAQQKTLHVTSNCKWIASTNNSWISVESSVEQGLLTISVDPNTLSSYRDGAVIVEYGNSTLTIKVTQSPAGITASETTLEYENVASKYDLEINAEADWTSVVSDSWIKVTPDSGKAGTSKVSIEVAPNSQTDSRSGCVTFRIGNSSRLEIAIQQRGIYIEADKSMEFSSAAQSKPLSIRSNTSWAVSDSPSWVKVSKTSGSGNTTVNVEVTENPNTYSRNGEILLTQPGLMIEWKVKIVQNGKLLTPDTQLLEFTDKGGQQTFNLTSDAAWKSSVSDSWISTTPDSGQGDASITVKVEPNNGDDERTAKIYYSYLDKETTVNVHQLGKYLSVDNNSFEFETGGGNHTIYIGTSDDWTARIEDNVSWLKLSKTSGTGEATITLTATDNATPDNRDANIIIETTYGQSVRIHITQQGRYLKVSAKSVMFFDEGGTSDGIRIDTNGMYIVNGDASWFTINEGSGNTFTVNADKNNTSDTRRGTITIRLTDLQEGTLAVELPVIQTGVGGSFILEGYPDDSNWDSEGNGSFEIEGYPDDSNWNKSAEKKKSFKVIGKHVSKKSSKREVEL